MPKVYSIDVSYLYGPQKQGVHRRKFGSLHHTLSSLLKTGLAAWSLEEVTQLEAKKRWIFTNRRVVKVAKFSDSSSFYCIGLPWMTYLLMLKKQGIRPSFFFFLIMAYACFGVCQTRIWIFFFAVVAFTLIFLSKFRHIPGCFLKALTSFKNVRKMIAFLSVAIIAPFPFVLPTCTVDFELAVWWYCYALQWLLPVLWLQDVHTKNIHPFLCVHQNSGCHCLAVYEGRNIIVE